MCVCVCTAIKNLTRFCLSKYYIRCYTYFYTVVRRAYAYVKISKYDGEKKNKTDSFDRIDNTLVCTIFYEVFNYNVLL